MIAAENGLVQMNARSQATRLPLWGGIAAILAIGAFVIADSAFAGGPATSTGTSTITGNIGMSPAAAMSGLAQGDAALASWPLFLAMVAYVLVLAFMVAARWRREEEEG